MLFSHYTIHLHIQFSIHPMLFSHYTIHLSTHPVLHPPNVILPLHHSSIYTSSSPSTQCYSPTTPSIYTSSSPSTQCYSPTTPFIYLHIYHSVDLMSLAYNTIHLSTRLSLHPPNVILPLHHSSIYTSSSPSTQCYSPTTPFIYLHIYLSVDLMSLTYNTIHLSTRLPLHPPNVISLLHHPSIYTSTSPSNQCYSPTTPSIYLHIYLSITQWYFPTTPSVNLHIYLSVDLMSLAYNTIHLSTNLPLHPPNVIPPLHHPSIYTSTSPSPQWYFSTTPSVNLHIYHSFDLMSLANNTIHLSIRLPIHPLNVIPPLHTHLPLR